MATQACSGAPSASPPEELLVGFEAHSARTYLGPTARALGQVVVGQGNNGDGREGVWLGGAVGTYLREPCLPRNPALADFLIGTALWRRYGAVELEPLADDAEHAAHDTAVRRITAAARAGKRPGLRRAGTRLGRVVLPPGNVSAAQCLLFVLFVTYSAGPGLAGLAPRPGRREASRTVGLMDER